MRLLCSLCVAALSLLMAGSAYLPTQDSPKIAVQIEPQANPWTHLQANHGPTRFQFAIVADRTGGHRPGVFESAIGKLNLLQPEFVVSVGDLIEGYTEDEALLDRQWDEFEELVRQLEMPFFFVPGNHDISNPVMARKWQQRHGRSYYHFLYQDVLFLCLNTEDPPESQISEEQVEYVRQTLEQNRNVRWTLVLMHKPLWTTTQRTGWERIEAMLQGRPYTVIAGHHHTYLKTVRNDQRYIVLATTGGSSRTRGSLFGEFDHVAWVTMTDQGPRIAHLMLDGIADENLRTEETVRRVRSLLEGRAVVATPILTEQTVPGPITTRLRLTNDADLPMQVRGVFEPNPVLRPQPGGLDLTVPPNTVEVVEFTLAPTGPRKAAEIPPLVMNWTATYTPPDQPPLEAKGTQRFVIEPWLDCPSRREPVVVDGQLDEWTGFAHVCLQPAQIRGNASAWMGPADCSFRFAVEHDQTNLYLAIETTDERPVQRAGKQPWEQDGIEVRLDARPDPERSSNRGQGDMTDFLLIALSPGASPEQMTAYSRERWPEGVRAVCVRTPTGHATEIAVPIAYLDQKQGGPWNAFRLNIAVDDFDDDKGPLTQLWWRPDWREELTYAGSGTFRRR